MVGGRAYANFHKMYQRAMKIARLIDEVGVESRAVSGGKRNLVLTSLVREIEIL